MKKIKLYIAASLDGYIASPKGDFDWLTQFPNPSGTDHGYGKLIDSIDTIIMGNSTYKDVLTMADEWFYKDKLTYVLTRHKKNLPPKEEVIYLTDNIIPAITQIKQQRGKDIWLVGGGQIITLLLNHNLVDEMQICYIPLILGEGIPLFPNKPNKSKWKLAQNTAYDSGILKVDYQFISE